MQGKTKKELSRLFKILVLILAVLFLYSKWESDTWAHLKGLVADPELWNARTFFLLFLILDLNTLAWVFEAERWRVIVKPWSYISRFKALKTVLGSLSFSFLTPNYMGDYLVRSFYLPLEHRKFGPAFTFISSVGHMMMLSVIGLLLGLPYLLKADLDWTWWMWTLSALAGLGTISVYLMMPWLFRQLAKIKRLKDYFPQLEDKQSLRNKLAFLVLSLLRYIIMCADEVLMLYIFIPELPFWEAFKAVTAYYFIITYIPHFVFTGPIVRSGVGVYIFSQLGVPTEISLAVISMSWFFGIGLHALVGLPFFYQIKPNLKHVD